jgi:hypothetical protein
MATVTGLTKDAMEAIRDGVIVDAEVVGNNLILTKFDNSTFDAGDVRGPAGPVSYPAKVTALPGSPTDGDEVILQTSAMAALSPAISWHCKYEGASGKWEVVGGADMFAEVTTGESRSTNSYGALTTAGPSIAIPVAGIYDVEIAASITTANATYVGAYMSYDIGGTTASDSDAAAAQVITPGWGTRTSRMRRKTLTAVTLTAKYNAKSSVSCSWSERTMRVTPVLLG